MIGVDARRTEVAGTEHLPGYDVSHTLALVDEAITSVEASCHELFDEFVNGSASRATRAGRMTHAVNCAFERMGFHVARASYARDVQRAQGDRRGGWRGIGRLRAMMAAPGDFDSVYERLADDASRLTFDWFVRSRTAAAFMGQASLSLYPSPGFHEESSEKARDLPQRRGNGYAVGGAVIESDLEAVLDCFVREQYRLEGRVEVRPGDVVLDLGAYKGESSVWLARQAGPSGLVLALEPNPVSRAFLKRNVARAENLGISPIRILPVAAGSSHRREKFVGTAEGCSRLDTGGAMTVDVTTLDDVVLEHELTRVDFVKMDIEGGEVDALKGARKTILQYAPRLAVSAYHLARDLPDIVSLVRELRPDYRFFLSQKSPGLYETMLFASVEGKPSE